MRVVGTTSRGMRISMLLWKCMFRDCWILSLIDVDIYPTYMCQLVEIKSKFLVMKTTGRNTRSEPVVVNDLKLMAIGQLLCLK